MRGVAKFANVPPICGALISAGLASMVELKRDLTLQDAYTLMEILEVKNYHQWLAADRAEKESNE